jgi:hypothetical protein
VLRPVALVLLAVAFFSQTGASQDVRKMRVREVPDSNLRDVAVAVADPSHPVIYYNPRLMERFGPSLSAFVLAHEYGHIRFGHRRIPAGRHVNFDRDSVLRGFELEADCYAARVLVRVKPADLRVAIEFFRKMGDFRYDTEHPTGFERAREIEACMVNDGTSQLAAGPGDQIRASLKRLPGEPAPMAMLKSSYILRSQKADQRERKPGSQIPFEKAIYKH